MSLTIKSKVISESMAKDILSNWKDSIENSEIYVIDSIQEYKLDLRVPINIRGKLHIVIKSEIQVVPKNEIKRIVMQCDNIKIIIYSALMGFCLGFMIFIKFHIILSVLGFFLAFLISYAIFQYKVKRTGQNFLNAIVRDSFNRMTESNYRN